MSDYHNLMTTTYSNFVAGLFTKPDSIPERLAHAAVGIIGEVVELRHAGDRDEQLEELGDIRFYIQAAFNQFPDAEITRIGGLAMKLPVGYDLHHASERLLEEAGNFLDLSKKTWIYGKPLEALHSTAMLVSLYQLRILLSTVANFYGFTLKDLDRSNRVKLIKRYPGGSYSDTAAQARADKQEGQ